MEINVKADYGQSGIFCFPYKDVGVSMNFGHNLRAARAAADMTQAELAKALGVTPPTVNRWETGKREPGLSEVERIALILRVPIGKLFE